jgi:TonB-dependent receptor
MLPLYFVATNSTKRNTRDGLMGVLEYKPNANLHSTLDLYYSKFDTHEVGNIFHENMFGAWGVDPALSKVGTTQVGQNTYTTSATVDHLPATTGNYDTKRSDTIAALGWNTSLKLDEKWTGIADLSFSRDSRKDNYMEVYGAPFDKASQSFVNGGYSWNVPIGDGPQSFVPLQQNFLSNPATYQIGANLPNFNWVPDNPAWAGAVRTPVTTDEIKSLRLSGKRSLDGIFSKLVTGLNYTQRDKNVSKNESRILMLKDAAGNYIRTVPNSAIMAPFSNGIMRIDVPGLVASGAVNLEPGQFTKLPANDSDVHEKVTTAFMKLDIDTELFKMPIRGNVGLQAVHASQNANGWEYRGDDAHPDPALLIQHSGGASYTNFLPSLNLVADLKNNWVARMGLAKTLARPNITDMSSGTSTPLVKQDNANLPTAGQWTMAYAGNPEIRPWIADSFDLSLEKYFGKRSYVSIAAFDKYLESFVYSGVTTQDNSAFPAYPPAGVTALKTGPVTKPLNGHGGTVKGVELSGALEGGLLTSMLDGFGVVASGTKLFSNMVDPNTGMQIKMNGLSGTSGSVTVYYEKHGFSARVSERYRAPFTATTRDIYGNDTTRQQDADRVVDLQLGYAFDSGTYKGLSLMLQVNNVTNHLTQDQVSINIAPNAPDPKQLVPNYRYYYGRQLLAGVNYKF